MHVNQNVADLILAGIDLDIVSQASHEIAPPLPMTGYNRFAIYCWLKRALWKSPIIETLIPFHVRLRYGSIGLPKSRLLLTADLACGIMQSHNMNLNSME